MKVIPFWSTQTGSFSAVAGGHYRCTNVAGAWIEITIPASGEFVVWRAGPGAVVVWASTLLDGYTSTSINFPRGITRMWHDGTGWRTEHPDTMGAIDTAGLAILCVADKGIVTSGSNVTSWTDQIGGRVFTVGGGTPTYSATGLTNHPGVAFPSSAWLTSAITGIDAYGTLSAAAWSGAHNGMGASRRTVYSRSSGTQGIEFGFSGGSPSYLRNNSSSSGVNGEASEPGAWGYTRYTDPAGAYRNAFWARQAFSEGSAISTYANGGADLRIGIGNGGTNMWGDAPLYGFAFWHTTTPTSSRLAAAVRWFHYAGTD